jgi:probable HAF family extracellular repeat protein
MRLQPRVVRLVALLTPIVAQYAPAATFHGLGFLPGTSSSVPAAISADGSTVVGHSGNSPFRWTAQAGMELFTGGDTPTAISADGSVVVGSSDGHAFRWSQASGTTDLGMLRGDHSATATGVSADGAIVVGTSVPYSDGGTAPSHAFRWTQTSGMQDMHAPYDASGVSADGSTIVGGNHRWTAATSWQYLGRFHPTAVDADGLCIVGTVYSGGGFGDLRGDTPAECQAWRWTPASGTKLLLR